MFYHLNGVLGGEIIDDIRTGTSGWWEYVLFSQMAFVEEELSHKVQVWTDGGSTCFDKLIGLITSQVFSSHDIGDCQSGAPGDSCQAVNKNPLIRFPRFF